MQFEITPIRYVGEEHAMSTSEGDAQYWGVYLRGDDGLAIHLVDCRSLEEAYTFVYRLDKEKQLPMVHKLLE